MFIQIILLNSQFNGAGLDLHEANHVILFHEMNAGLELQTISRAQRPGRNTQLQVWKLAYSYEFLEKN
jgi:SNF2 family DNA or RNA helicase